MRLHRLTLTAIGPFAEKQSIDFDLLSESGLFLLEGPTGAGKSTVLDAITFALYGSVAGDDADAARLHSHFADPDTRPEVTLEFSLKGTRYRITRSPSYVRPKKVGDGTTLEKSSAHLQKLAGEDWTSLSDKHNEIAEIVERELGLNREQFTQVVLLPQGEFAKFLKSDDDTRRKLLTKLFGAERYERITEWFKNAAQAARAEQKTAELEITKSLAQAIEAAQVEDDVAASWQELTDRWAPEAAVRLNDVLAAHAESAAASVKAASVALDAAEESMKKTQKKHDDLAEESGRIRRLKAATDRKAAHEALADERTANKATVAAAQRAAIVRPLIESVDTAGTTLTTQTRAAEKLAGGPEQLAELGDDWKALQQKGKAAGLEASSLDQFVQLEASLPGKVSELDELVGRVGALEATGESLKSEQRVLPQQAEKLEQQLTQAQVAAGKVAGLEKELATWRGRSAAILALDELKPKLDAAQASKQAAVDAYQDAVDDYQRLMEQRILGMTGELSTALVDGEPCQVCGSKDHPEPAAPNVEAVTGAQIDEAVQVRDAAQKVRDTAEKKFQSLKNMEAAEQAKAGEESAEQVAAHIQRLQEDLGSASAQADTVESLVDALADVKERIAGIDVEMSGTATELASLQTERKASAKAIASDEKQIAEAADEFASVKARVEDLRMAADRFTGLGEAIRAIEVAREALRSAEAAAGAEATAQGFADVAAAAAALLEPENLAELEDEIAAWESEGAAVAELLGAPELADVDLDRAGVIGQELENAEVAVGVASDTHQAAVKELSGLTSRASRFDERRAEVGECLNTREALQEKHLALLDLDELARGVGRGISKMTLTTYVLRLWFEQVVQAANTRLHRIAGGKYELRRTEEAAKGNARVGLGLMVFDRHTGKERSPGSLSGGETFYTSLALALGLADVVQAEAGGISLDTLFIDEGFGSLDSDTLEEVLTVIDGLRDNGRVVGIVSHVEVLKERVPERLKVRRTRDEGPSEVRVVA